MKIISILVLFCATSCVTVPPLSEGGSKVRVTSDPNVVTNCKFIQAITVRNASPSVWEAKVKNEVAEIGANAVFSLTIPPYPILIFRGEAYHCK